MEITTAATSGGISAPDEIQLLPAGEFSGRDGRGPWRCDPAAVVSRTREGLGGLDIPVDYDHQIEFSQANGRPAPAAGWITGLEARPDGVWGRVEWTDGGRERIEAREYRYISPVYYYSETGDVIAVESAALTNIPNLSGLKALSAKEPGQNLSHGEDSMSFLKTMASALGMSEAEPTEALVESAARAMTGELADLKAAMSAVNRAAGGGEEGSAGLLKAVQSLAAKAEHPDPARFVPIGVFNETHAELGRLKAAQSAALVERGKTEGRISPAMEEWAKAYASADPAGFEKFLGTAPDLRPGKAAASATPPGKPDAGKGGVPDTAKALCRAIGVSEESYLKTRAAKTTEKDDDEADE